MTGLLRRYAIAAGAGITALCLVWIAQALVTQAFVTQALVAPALVTEALAQSNPRPVDANRGAVIATQGTASSPACAQCHVNAVSDSSGGTFPRIAGQPTDYLAKQMHAFTSPARDNAFMSPIAKALSADEIADVAAHYGSAQGDFSPLPPTDAALVGRGQQLARVGDAERRIQACNNCTGPTAPASRQPFRTWPDNTHNISPRSCGAGRAARERPARTRWR